MITIGTILLALLLLAAPAAAQPTNVSVSPLGSPDATGASYTVAWSGGAVTWVGGYNDGSAGQQGVTTLSPFILRMPYHASGAASGGWLCLSSVSPAGTSCVPFTVPAKTAGPPPPTTTLPLAYREPSINANGAPLTNLGTMRAYWRLGTGPESMVVYPASSSSGGATRTQSLTVPATSGTVHVYMAAVNASGQEGARSSPVASRVIDVPPPPPPPPVQYLLTATATAGGAVSGTGSYPAGTVVSPKQAAATGFVFAGWSGACSGAWACSVTMDSNKSVLATFAPAPPPPPVTFLLTMTALGAGIISPATGSYVAGTPVTLIATPGVGHAFLGWSGDPDCGDGEVTMSGPRSCTATFARIGPPPPPPPPASRCIDVPTSGWSTSARVLYQQEVVNCRLLEELLAR